MSTVSWLTLALLSTTSPTAQLTYLRGPGADACVQQRLEDAVATRLGYRPFLASAPMQVVVEISGKGQLQAKLRIFEPKKRPKESVVNGPADCDALTEALALALAVAIDPLALTRGLSPPQPQAPAQAPMPDLPAPEPMARTPLPSTISVEPQAPETQRTAPATAPPAVSSGLWLTAMGGLDLGAQPGALVSVALGLSFSRGVLGLELNPFLIIPSVTTLAPSGEVSTWSAGGAASGCWLWEGLGACGALRLGGLYFQAKGLSNAQSGWTGFLSAGPRVWVRLPWHSPLVAALRIQGELLFPVVRATMVVSNDVVWRQSMVAGTLQLGAELHLL